MQAHYIERVNSICQAGVGEGLYVAQIEVHGLTAFEKESFLLLDALP